MNHVRSFILLGQYGFGSGMLALQEPLSKFGPVTSHQWYDNGVINEINRTSGIRIAVIGFSLGANQLGYIGQNIRRPVDLGVAYDPSRKSPMARQIPGGRYVEDITNFNRVICFYNPTTWWFGGACYIGPGVEIREISSTHFGVPYIPALHDVTIAAVKHLSEQL